MRLSADATLAFINALATFGGGNEAADARLADWLHTHAEQAVRDAARTVLAGTLTRLAAGGNSKRLKALLELADDRSGLYEEVCRQVVERPTSELVAWLVGHDPRVSRSQAARLRALAELPVDPRVFLADLAGEPSRVKEARRAAMRHLERLLGGASVPVAALAEVLRADGELCREAVARCLEQPGEVPGWIEALWPTEEADRVAVLGLWAARPVAGVEGRAVEALGESQPVALRRAAAGALASLGTARSLEALREAARGFFGDSEVKRLARAAIDAISSRVGTQGGLSVSEGASARGGLSGADASKSLDPER
ncbi:MAG: hypothetical protein R3F43_21575 [bacterium]